MPLNIVNHEESFARAIQMHTQGRYAEAENLYKQVLQYSPNHPGATQNLGVLAFQVGRMDVAVPLLKKAIEQVPNNAALYCNLGDVYAALRQGDDAIRCYEKSIELDPNMATVYNNLGIVYSRLGRVEDAINVWEKAISLADRPSPGGRVLVGVTGGGAPGGDGDEGRLLSAAANNNLGNAHLQQLELEEALACHRRACELNPTYANARSNMLRDMTHMHNIPPEEFLREHKKWWEIHSKGIKQMDHKNIPDPDRKIRIGWVSSDFREHSVTHFLLNIFQHFDRNKFEYVCYSGVNRPDEFTQMLAQCTPHWRNTLSSQDDELAKLVNNDAIDIFIDLSGHTSDHRLRVFAYKPSPVQATYLGYPMTSGSPFIDWRIGDPLCDPEGMTDNQYSEKLYRLPHTMWCYRPPVNIPAEETPPILRDGNTQPFTFGSFNNCSKMSPVTFELWARVLNAVPNSRIIVKAAAMADRRTRERIQKGLAAHGVAPERVITVQQQLNLADHFAYYGNIDLGLDTIPYNGTTTTCEALWMNVPVVTMAGNMHIARVGASLLTNAGMPQLVAQTPDQFVDIATSLAKDTAALGALRKGLRARLVASPLMDGPTFAREFDAALRYMWQQWCATRK
jgi:predicted O-linked N-acetylglucosamine transferase (SPINDLY family)